MKIASNWILAPPKPAPFQGQDWPPRIHRPHNPHHWLFDHGLISVDTHYNTLVADSIEIEMPANVLRQYHRAPIILPREPEKYPAPAALEWHRENVFGG